MKHYFQIIFFFSLFYGGFIQASESDKWRFELVPYAWAVHIDGDIEAGTPDMDLENQLIHVNEKFSDILKHINSGAMGGLSAHKDKFGFVVDFMFADYTTEKTTSDGFEIQVHSKYKLITGYGSYKIFERNISKIANFSLFPYAGARYTSNTINAHIVDDPSQTSGPYVGKWTDPFIGIKLQFEFPYKLQLELAGDKGLMKKDDRAAYNMVAMLRYNAYKYVSVFAGYRNMYQAYTSGSGQTFFVWKIHTSGPIAGVVITF